MSSDERKIVCQTPTPGKKPTRIAKWKYDLVRSTILKVVFRDGLTQEIIALFGPVAMEGAVTGHFINPGMKGLDAGIGQGSGDIAYPQFDDALIWICLLKG